MRRLILTSLAALLLAGCSKTPPPTAMPPAAPVAKAPASPAEAEIDLHRAAIDAIDAQVVDLLSQRAEHALAIGRARAAAGIAPSSAKGRQQVVIDRAKQHAKPPLPPESAGRIYQTVIAEMVALQAKDAAQTGVASPQPAPAPEAK